MRSAPGPGSAVSTGGLTVRPDIAAVSTVQRLKISADNGITRLVSNQICVFWRAQVISLLGSRTHIICGSGKFAANNGNRR